VLSGAEVATQRSFIMTAVVLIGVMADRPALTLRTIAVAALAVMLLAPEAVVHPSFQMSFAATLALIAAYERSIPWIAAGPKPRSAPASRYGAREKQGSSCWRRWWRVSRPCLMRPIISTGSPLMACWPTCWRCR
jgi:competence protein ComEC